MFVVAGMLVIESPAARVTISLPSTVTRTMTALRCVSAIVSRTIAITASASAGAAVGAGDSAEGGVAGTQPASNKSAQVRPRTRRARGMSDLGTRRVWG